ncbi:pre-mRNA 3'-end-processing factor FIP1-like [Mercenaria mercenaria]|uniref:pre-mRNA 3'-end-processing factor FIP1-like n=1 Tax=Mercenaria mercenaria TaxID=6596 RepID=UPI00234F33C5|nr:pre-mRNA 3'-end-processing factor FIP1-like [Mercenaria mercenaria]
MRHVFKMATVVAKPPGVTEDDEEWLYGDSGGNKEPAAPGTGPEEKLPPLKEDVENTENSQPQTETNNDDDDDSDDEDNVQVTIGDITAFPVASTGSNLFKPTSTYQKQPVTAGSAQKGAVTTQATKGVDVDGEGTVNGIPLYEFSLDTLRDEDKPWRKPGADITDYFNYGFNEETWRKYCQKQNRIRAENGVTIPKAFGSVGYGTTVKVESSEHHSGPSHFTKTYTPASQQPTAIAVLGSTTASRRPIEETMDDVQQIGTLSSDTNKSSVPPTLPPVGLPPPDYSVPPPGMPPMPPGFSPAVPPPGMNVPPPNMYGHPPPVPPPFFPPHHVPPPSSTQYPNPDRPTYSYDATPPASGYSDSKSSWDRDRDRDRDSYRDRDRDRDRDSDGSDDYRYSRSSKDYGRDYDRDYYRSRDSERSRSDRDRSRSRERDSRRHRDRDRDRDDKKSKRKVKDEPDDSDYYKSSSSSKHKKSKRSKRDKDDESDKQTDEGT